MVGKVKLAKLFYQNGADQEKIIKESREKAQEVLEIKHQEDCGCKNSIFFTEKSLF